MNAPIDVTGIRVETERLILRPWRESDLHDFYEYAKVDGVGQMAGWLPHKSPDDTKVILDMFITNKKTLAIVWKQTGKVIGSLGIEPMRPDPEGSNKMGRELGYVLGKDYWGMGLMTEAVNAVINYCFDVLDFDYLTCGHFVQNTRSRRVIEKCGFQFFDESEFTTHMGTVEIARNYLLYNPNK